MALDFPNSPTVGQVFGNYTWDGTKWVLTAGSGGGGGGGTFPEAPVDGHLYGRQNTSWVDAWASPVLSGDPKAPTASPGDNDTSVATTAFVTAAVAASVTTVNPSNAAPVMNGVAAAGVSVLYSRGDHVHPSDNTKAATTYVDTQDALRATITYVDTQDNLRAPINNPTLTGNPQAPTQTPGNSSTSLATTAFVAAAVTAGGGWVDAPSDGSSYGRNNAVWAKVAPLTSPALGGTPTAPTAAPTTNTTQIATTAFVTAAVTASGGITPSPLTKVNDTNVTVTLGGTPATALLQPTSITMGWTGTLSPQRGGFGLDISAQNGVPLFATGVPTFTGTSGTGNFARINGPVFTGDPQAPTASPGDNDTSIATTAFVTAAVAAGSSGTGFPSGTVMLFYQAAAPTGWTQVTTQNDKALRVVSGGTGGSAGGTNSFSTVMAQTVVGNHTLTAAENSTINTSGANTITTYALGAVANNYAVSTGTYSYVIVSSGSGYYGVTVSGQDIRSANYDQASNTITGASTNTSGNAHNHPITMAIQYCDVILASKN